MNKYKEALSNIHKHGKTMTWDDAGAIIEALNCQMDKEKSKPLCGEFSYKDQIECIHPDWNARTDCRNCELINSIDIKHKTDYQKMQNLFNELGISYDEGENSFCYSAISIWYSNIIFLFDINGKFVRVEDGK